MAILRAKYKFRRLSKYSGCGVAQQFDNWASVVYHLNECVRLLIMRNDTLLVFFYLSFFRIYFYSVKKDSYLFL